MGFFDDIGDAFVDAGDTIADTATTAGMAIAGAATTAGKAVAGAATTAVGAVTGIASKAVVVVKGLVNRILGRSPSTGNEAEDDAQTMLLVYGGIGIAGLLAVLLLYKVVRIIL